MQNFYSSINTPSLPWLHPAKYQCKLGPQHFPQYLFSDSQAGFAVTLLDVESKSSPLTSSLIILSPCICVVFVRLLLLDHWQLITKAAIPAKNCIFMWNCKILICYPMEDFMSTLDRKISNKQQQDQDTKNNSSLFLNSKNTFCKSFTTH